MSKEPVKEVKTLNKKKIHADVSRIQRELLDLLETVEYGDSDAAYSRASCVAAWSAQLAREIAKSCANTPINK